MSSITERVERGAALLDEKRPGWLDVIDLDRLDIDSPCNCIIGQVGDARAPADYLRTLRSLGIAGFADIAYGFEADDDGEWLEAEYENLRTAWRDLILARRATALVPA